VFAAVAMDTRQMVVPLEIIDSAEEPLAPVFLIV